MKKKMNSSVKSIIVLVAICLFIAVAMAAVNLVTAPKIAEATAAAEQEALAAVMPENGGFEKLDIDGLPECVRDIYRDLDGEGYVTLLEVKGYDASNPMSVAVGFTSEGNITECYVISASGETSGIGSKVTEESFLSQFSNKNKELDGVDAISGATISSSSLIDAVRQSFEALEKAGEVS